VQGIDEATLPVILGQVMTFPKAGSTIVLETEKGPLLAAWRYGLGRSIAFTSDLSGRWGKEWVRWDQYGQFTAQMMKWVQRKETEKQYMVEVTREGEQGTFIVDVTDQQFMFVNHLKLNANLLLPSQQNETVALEQVAPGRYQGQFPAEEIGEYYFTLFNESFSQNQETSDQPEVFGYGVPYTDEFIRTDVNVSLLQHIAEVTQGEMLQPDDIPDDLFAVTSEIKDYGILLWPYCAGTFLFLLLANVAVRKFVNPV